MHGQESPGSLESCQCPTWNRARRETPVPLAWPQAPTKALHPVTALAAVSSCRRPLVSLGTGGFWWEPASRGLLSAAPWFQASLLKAPSSAPAPQLHPPQHRREGLCGGGGRSGSPGLSSGSPAGFQLPAGLWRAPSAWESEDVSPGRGTNSTMCGRVRAPARWVASPPWTIWVNLS